MTKPEARTTGMTLLVILLLFSFWYVEAGNFEDRKVAGEYTSHQDGVTRKLWLKQDHTFSQEDLINGQARKASGTWQGTTSTGHFAFSSDFLDEPNGSRGSESNEVYATFENWFGFVSITFNNSNLRLYKKPLS